MKTLVIPLVEQDPNCCNCFKNDFMFKEEWCLDLHGFLSRDEFDIRLNEINNYIRNYPLMSENAKKFVILISMMLIVLVAPISYSSTTAFIVVELLLASGFIMALYQVNRIASIRVEKFNAALNDLFTRYNLRENPTANWKLRWRSVLTHYNTFTKFGTCCGVSYGRGKITPQYAEQIEIVLEINDALSDLTAQTVHVNLVPNAISVSVTQPITSQPRNIPQLNSFQPNSSQPYDTSIKQPIPQPNIYDRYVNQLHPQ
jgi:hypothetical protein